MRHRLQCFSSGEREASALPKPVPGASVMSQRPANIIKTTETIPLPAGEHMPVPRGCPDGALPEPWERFSAEGGW